MRLAGFAAGCTAVAGTLVGVALIQRSGMRLDRSDLVPHMLVVLLSALVVAALVWVLSEDREGVDHEAAQPGRTTRCTVCGGIINTDWRLCPHCGERLPTFDA